MRRVIGTGKVSEEHLRFLKADPRVTLAAVCDLSPSLAKYAVERFGARQAFTDSAQMFAEVRPDVVHVLTPPHTHPQLVRDALNAGSHVICEKPVASNHREFRELWSLAESQERRIIEDHNYRFNEPVQAMEKMAHAGELGEIREVDVRMALAIRKPGGRYADANLPHPSHRLPAGVIHEFISHLCYLTLRFLPEFDRVAAAWSNHGNDTVFKYDDLDALVIGGAAHARIRFTCHSAPDCFTLTVRGTRGWAETDLFQPHLRKVVPRKGGAQLAPLVNQFANGATLDQGRASGVLRNKIMQKTPYEGLRTFLDQTYDALLDGHEPPVTFDDMDRASRLIEALLDEANRV